MFVDASAIVAILGREPGHEEIEKRQISLLFAEQGFQNPCSARKYPSSLQNSESTLKSLKS